MARLRHGEVHAPASPGKSNAHLGLIAHPLDLLRPAYGFMFPALAAEPSARLAETEDTGRRLFALASVMTGTHSSFDRSGDSGIPAGFTYFGQLVDHDITLEQSTDGENLPLSTVRLDDPAGSLTNARIKMLDLDCVYGNPAPRDPANSAKMRLGQVSTSPPRPAGKDIWNDLPRQGRSRDVREDRAALIGDPRNDENLIVAQLHVAFLRAHNALVDKGCNYAEAQGQLRAMYQSVIFTDFLPRIADPTIVHDVLSHGPRFWNASSHALFVPLEFAAAAFRFGHSMIRSEYDINESFGLTGRLGQAPLQALFTFTAMSGNFNPTPTRDFDTLPENWIVEWHRLVPVPGASLALRSRRIDTTLSPGLDDLRNEEGVRLPEPVAVRLAARNLLRGYRLGLPTGQAVARTLGIEPLIGDDLLDVLPERQQKLVDALGFSRNTPLWFYILAEAGDPRSGQANGRRLGKVGSTIIVETLYNLASLELRSAFLNGGRPEVVWSLLDILNLAGVA